MSDHHTGDEGRESEPTRRLPPEDETRQVQKGPPEGRSGILARFSDRDLGVAIGVGVLLVALLIATVLLSRVAFTVLVGALILGGVIEAGREFRRKGVDVSVPVLIVSGVVMLVGAHRAGHAGQAVGLLTLFFGAIIWELTDRDRRNVIQRVGATVLLGVWVPFLGSYAVLLHAMEAGWVAIIATAFAAFVADIGAYFFGMWFGERKLAPSLSPGKTWEGVLGGLALSVAFAVIVFPLLGSTGMFSPGVAALFAAIVAASGIVGDLTESMMKRDLGVKDFGGIFPGHGGVLDRVDAILFALPVGFYLLDVLGR